MSQSVNSTSHSRMALPMERESKINTSFIERFTVVDMVKMLLIYFLILTVVAFLRMLLAIVIENDIISNYFSKPPSSHFLINDAGAVI